MFSFIYLFAYANDYFLYICIFLFTIRHTYIYIYIIFIIYIYIIFLYIIVKENVSIKSTKFFGAEWNNFCRLNDFKENDKIDFEARLTCQIIKFKLFAF